MKGKLVRDKIPAIILKNDGKKPRTRVLAQKEYRLELAKKLQEEIQEMLAARSKKDIAEEVADIEEVLDAFLALHKLSRREILKIQKEKKLKRGGFSKRIFLIQ